MRPINSMLFGIVAAACLIGPLPARAQSVNWTWTNQYGSTLAITSFNQNTGAIAGTYTNNAASSCDEGKPQGVTGWLAYGNTGTAISFSVNYLGCGSTTVWTGQLNNSAGFQGLWYLSLGEAVAWNGISAGADTFTFSSGDKTLLTKSGVDLKAASEKLSNTKK
ncbi:MULTISPECIES: avidin/streptavidin family protein [unclassified Bradyrhizobium]|uniref:avidin/streptavidin family protein n=1 Tax=unclassified Bradyrhizobium TaxID=2631580 RepID=UPI0023064304|nr:MULTISPECIES: avidin/streptavidin family protein [unclassified Bradyrhizobium]MDA9405468.1 avidin [Bradyrhizobium sp. CCBAU 45384]MDA9438610.1 avidin [Bradyrhizobium sp. CCBAU 51745]